MNNVIELTPCAPQEALVNRTRATQVMTEHGLDAIVVSSRHNVTYATNYHSHGQWLMPAAHTLAVLPRDPAMPTVLVLSHGELDVLAEQSVSAGAAVAFGRFFLEQDGEAFTPTERTVQRFRETDPADGIADALHAALDHLGVAGGCVGVDATGMLPPVESAIRARLDQAGASTVEGYAPLQRIRMVKTPAEVERLRRSVQVTEAAVRAVVGSFHPGQTEQEMLRVYEDTVLDLGARPTFAHILVGERGALAGGPASDRALAVGESVRFDVGCLVAGYNSDIARTVAFGGTDDWTRDGYQAILAGELAAFDAVKPGITAGELFDIAVTATRENGLPGYARHHVGHGIGIELYDPPIIVEGDPTPLEVGMVMNLETPYYVMGRAGLQVEDTFVVTDDGYDMFTTLDQGLWEVSA